MPVIPYGSHSHDAENSEKREPEQALRAQVTCPTDSMDAPKWLSDEPIIHQILNKFLDRLDKRPEHEANQLRSIPLNEKEAPNLFHPIDKDDPEQTWQFLQSLEQQGILRISRAKAKSFEPEYLNAKVHLQLESVPIIRRWLNRPHPSQRKHLWHEWVQQYANFFPGSTELLAAKPIEHSSFNTEEVLQGLAQVGQFLNQDLYHTQISALCFKGDSKFLNSREELLECLYPGYSSLIRLRPVLLQVALCADPQGILFIENEDCFLQATQGRYPHIENLVLVFASGFRSSATRIRQPGGVQFFYAPDRNGQIELFENYWLNRVPQNWRLFFWRDLDFSGMTILRS